MDHFQAIRAFARVVETGGFNRAADSLGIPNATLSKAVQWLEKHLGVKLLERTTRRVTVTPDGAAYYERTKHVLAELDEVESTFGRAHASPRGRSRIDTGGSTASGLLIPALPDFRARYPDIQIQLGVTDRTVDVIGENIDCAIRSTANDGALISRKIGTLAWTTCASPAYLAQHGKPRRPDDLAKKAFPVVGYFPASQSALLPLRFRRAGQSMQIDPHCDVMVNESNAHVAAALAGLGAIQTLNFMVRPGIERGELVPILANWCPPPLDIYIAYAPSRQLSGKVRVFIDWVTELYRGVDAPAALKPATT